MKKIQILSSWDDAGSLDMTLAQLLLKYNIPAVFYIPIETRDLTSNDIRKLAGVLNCDMCHKTKKLFEVGAHTMTHPENLRYLDDNSLDWEISESKRDLQNIVVQRKITKFCYPSGRFDERVKQYVQAAGFKEARTTRPLKINFPKDPFETDPTIHVHPAKPEYEDETWKELAEKKFDEVLEKGGRFEIWGHSFELEKYNMWEFLEDFLWYMNEKMNEIGYIAEKRNPNKIIKI